MTATSVCGLTHRGIRAFGATVTSSMWRDWLPRPLPTRTQLSNPGAAPASLLKSRLLMIGIAKTPEERRKPGLLRCRLYCRLPVHHVIAAQEFPGCGVGAFALLERYRPIDDGIADAFGLLDQAALAAREVGGIDRVVIQEAELLLLVDDDVGGVTLPQDTPICEPGDPGRQTADFVMGLFEAHDLTVARPRCQQINRPSAQGQVADMGATVRDAGVDIGMI